MNIPHLIGHSLLHALEESLRILPFLFLTYLLMEFLEHRASERAIRAIEKAGKAGPLCGGLLGTLPQCGFSAMAAELYAGRVITLGTLFSVFLSASDEMLPVMIAGNAPPLLIVKFIGTKAVVGMLYGCLADLILHFVRKHKEEPHGHTHGIAELCQSEHCHCGGKGIFRSAVHHTVPVLLFLFLISAVLTFVMELVGTAAIREFLTSMPAIAALLSALVGCIPNCASSVLLTELYLSGVLSGGAAMAGLLTGAGIGGLVLIRSGRRLRESLAILGILFILGAGTGFLFDVTGFSAFFLT